MLLVPVVQKRDNAIQCIVQFFIGFPNTYPLVRDLYEG